MNVVIATGIFPPDVGGPATHTSQLAESLRARGHDVTVLTLTDGPRPVREPGLVRYPRRWPWPVRTAAVAGWLLRRRAQYDVVYSNGLDLPAVTCGGGRVVLKVVGDHAWERGRRLRLTTASFDDFQSERPRSARLRAMRAVRTWTAAHAAVVVTPSDHLRRTVEGWTGGRRPVEVVPNGATPVVPATPPPDDAPLRLAYLGRLVENKRVGVLVDAVAATPGVTLTVVGDGPERDRLVAQAGLCERVRFCGPLPHAEAMRVLAASHALVNASPHEGLPHVAVEALVHGVPVLCAPSFGAAEVVEDGRNGLLVEDFPAAFAQVRDDRDVLRRLAAGAEATGAGWTFDRTADRVERLLLDVAGGDREHRPRAIFVGRAIPFPPSAELCRKFALHARLLRQTSVTTGGRPIEWVGGVRVVSLPQPSRGIVGGAVFYSSAPLVALALTVGRRRTAIVCQSPYEALGIVAVPRALRPRVQIELHGDWRSASRLYGSRARAALGPVADRLAEWSLRRADRVRAVSQSLADTARDAGYTGPIDQHFTFSDFSAFLSTPPAAPPAEPLALFVGVLERYKAVDLLLAAWEGVVDELPGARLLLVGAGTLEGEVRRRVTSGRNVELRPPVTQPELALLYDAATCLVLPSRSEGLPRVVMEAMARGRPVVASDVGGMRELVQEGVTGRVVPAEDVGALAKALREVLANPEAAAGMGQAARTAAEARNPVAEYEEGIRRLAAWIAAG